MGKWRYSDWAVNLEQRGFKTRQTFLIPLGETGSLPRRCMRLGASSEVLHCSGGWGCLYAEHCAVPLEIMWIGFVLYVCTMCVIIYPSIHPSRWGGKMCTERMSGKCLKYDSIVLLHVWLHTVRDVKRFRDDRIALNTHRSVSFAPKSAFDCFSDLTKKEPSNSKFITVPAPAQP